MPVSFAGVTEPVLNETGQYTPTKTLGQANAEPPVTTEGEIPSGTAIQNPNPLSLPPQDGSNNSGTVAPAEAPAQSTSEDPSASPLQNYEYERYDFEDALELLRPEYASAMIVNDLSREDLDSLTRLRFEVGIAVISGEIVIFTTGSDTDIGILEPARKLLDEAVFISHTHNSGFNPSSFDLKNAVPAPGAEYVLTTEGVYAYNSDGLLNGGQAFSLDEYLEFLDKAVQNDPMKDQVHARSALNEFIKEMDLYNTAADSERTVFRQAAISWTGAGGNNLWSNAANWSGGVKPGTGDTVTFNGNVNCTIDEAINVANITLASGYTGTITQQADVSVADNFSQSGGQWIDLDPTEHTFNVGGSFSTPASPGAFNRFGDQVDGAYRVRNVYDLQAMNGFLSDNFTLANNIDASSTVTWNVMAGFAPIGSWNASHPEYAFTGTFYGGGYLITGLTIRRPTENYVGLFGFAGSGSSIGSVGLVDLCITGTGNVGALVGKYVGSGLISDSYASGDVSGSGDGAAVGGLVGVFSGSGVLSTSHFFGDVRASTEYASIVGGLVGVLSGTIENSYAGGDVDGWVSRGSMMGSYVQAGGLVGSNSGTINNSYSDASVYGSYQNGPGVAGGIGGLVGINYGMVTNAYSVGPVSGSVRLLVPDGVVVSYSGGNYSYSYNSSTRGVITEANENVPANVGGFIGYNYHPIDNPGFLNCSWYVGSALNAIGKSVGSIVPTKRINLIGSSSDAISVASFYSQGNAVYGSWDFAGIWDSFSDALPRFKWAHDVYNPTVVIDAATPTLIQVKTLTVYYTSNGVVKAKIFEDLAEGANTLTITEDQTTVTHQVFVDTSIPTGSLNINSGAAYATSSAVTLNLSASDAGSGIDTMSFSTNGTTWSTPEPYSASRSFTLSGGDGVKTVYVKYYDKAGNVSQTYSRSIGLESANTPPTGSISINNGATHTDSTAVTLNLSAADAGSGVDTMSFSSDGVNWTAPETFAASRSFTLSGGDGAKTVYVKYYDKAGNVSQSYSRTITLDTVAPTIVLDPATPSTISVGSLTVQYTVDGVAKQKTFTNLVSGSNTLTITGSDLAGNTASIVHQVLVTAPVTASWIYTGTGTAFWSNPANWAGGVVPGAGSTVVFNASNSNKNCVIDVPISVANITIESSYSGTITQQADVAVMGDFIQAGGKWVAANPTEDSFSVGGSFTLLAPPSAQSFNRYGPLVDGAYQVRDIYDLQAIDGFLSSNFLLTQDIDASQISNWSYDTNKGFRPLGNSNYIFTGNFNGGGHVISNLTMDRNSVSGGTGLFAVASGTISNLGLVNVNVLGPGRCGGLVGLGSGALTITNSYVRGSIQPASGYSGGGLVGAGTASISNSYYDIDSAGLPYVAPGGLYSDLFDAWLANDKSLNIANYFTQSDGYYLLQTVSDLKNFLAFSDSPTLKFKLASDIDLATLPGFFIPYLRVQEFDGADHVITGLLINSPWDGIGFFGSVQNSAIKNLGILNARVNPTAWGNTRIGGLAGKISDSSISRSYSAGFNSGSLTGNAYVGALVGESLNSSITDSYSTGGPLTVVESTNTIGGLVGYASGTTITNAYSSLWISNTGNGSNIGGLVGASASSAISNSYSVGGVSYGSRTSLGGLLGYNLGGTTITQSYFTDQYRANGYGVLEAGGKAAFYGAGHLVYAPWNFSTVWRSSTGGLPYLFDRTGPSGTLGIATGAVYTKSLTVPLTLTADDPTSGVGTMSFSSDGVNWTAPEVFATSKSFTLSGGDGAKAVYVKYYDRAGNVSQVYSTTITLDTSNPVGSININSGAPYTTSSAVTLNLSASDAGSGIDKMSFSTNGSTWFAEPYAASKSFTLSGGDGTKTVYVKYYDKAGNVSSVFSKSIRFESGNTPPTGSISINYGATHTNSTIVALTLSAADAGSGVGTMSFSTDDVNWTTPETYTASKSFALSGGDGAKTVYVKYYDKIGNVSQSYSKTITLDTVAPTIVLDPATPSLIQTKTVVVNYTLEGVARQKTFSNLAEGLNTLSITETDLAGNQTTVTKIVTVDTIAPAIVLDAATPSLINETTLTVRYTVDGVAKTKLFENLAVGKNTLKITETDLAGNEVTINFTVIVGANAVRYKETLDELGRVIGFEENIFDEAGNFLYKLVRTGVVRNTAGTVISYRETFTIPFKGTLSGAYLNGNYTLTGTVKINNLSQAIQRRVSLGSEDRVFFEEARTEIATGAGYLVMGFGEASTFGKLTSIRYKETLDKLGRVTEFEEHVFDEAGNFLYKLVRKSVTRNLAGAVTGYRETLTIPLKGTLSGVFSNGVYKMTGTLKINGVSQVINWTFNVDPSKRDYWVVSGADGRYKLVGSHTLTVKTGTPSLINKQTLTVAYTLDGVAKTKTFTGLVEGGNILTITETDLWGNKTTATHIVTVDLNASPFTWIYSGMGANLWSIGANWLGGIAPSFTDTAVFGPYSISDCLINTAVKVTNITIASGYTGTITQRANITVTSDFSQFDGTFTGISGSVNVGRDFNVTGGSFNIGAQTVNVAGNAFFSGGTLKTNSGARLNILNDLHYSGSTVDMTGSTVDVDGDFYWTGGAVSFSSLFRLAGNWNQTGGTVVGTRANTVEFNGTADQNYYSAIPYEIGFYNLTYSGHRTLHAWADICIAYKIILTYGDGWVNLHGNTVYGTDYTTLSGAGQYNIIY